MELAIENGIPCAIYFMNPVPDADVHSVGETNFEWIVEQVAGMTVARVNTAPRALALRRPGFWGAPAHHEGRAKQKAAPKGGKLV
ncbi:MAG: hypothetical protein WB341_02780 [Terracidiphilus sp.]